MTPETLDETIPNDAQALAALAERVGAFLESRDVAPATAYATSLALEEMATNIIKYGYDDSGRHEIHVRLAAGPDGVRLLLEDDGHPFDPLAAPAPNTDLPLSERGIGGLGIHLVRKTVREMTYARVGGRNRLEIRV